jgi:SHS2 domain-containing protein
MPYRLLEHTADLKFEVTAGSFEELIGEALLAMTEWTRPVICNKGQVERPITVHAEDRTALLVDFLNEVLAFSQIYREAYRGIMLKRLTGTDIDGVLTGAETTGAGDEIKAVTYHGATVDQRADGIWCATILMDI